MIIVDYLDWQWQNGNQVGGSIDMMYLIDIGNLMYDIFM